MTELWVRVLTEQLSNIIQEHTWIQNEKRIICTECGLDFEDWKNQ